MSLKTSIQGLLRRFPALTRNRLYYHIQRYRQYRPIRIDRSLTTRNDIIDSLERDGIFIIPDFAPKEICEKIIAELHPAFSQMLDGRYQGSHQMNADYGPYRLLRADNLSPTAKGFYFENAFITEIARAYVSEGVISYRREADFKVNPGKLTQSDLPHFDDWRHRFKAFLYLTDVSEKNGPLVYYKGSHRPGQWNHRYNLEYEMDGMDGRYGHFFPQEMRQLMKTHDFKEVTCVGNAGTLIFADFRGIHKGAPMLEGQRWLLNNTFGIVLPGIL